MSYKQKLSFNNFSNKIKSKRKEINFIFIPKRIPLNNHLKLFVEKYDNGTKKKINKPKNRKQKLLSSYCKKIFCLFFAIEKLNLPIP